MKLTPQELARLEGASLPPVPPRLPGFDAGPTPLAALVRFRRARLGLVEG